MPDYGKPDHTGRSSGKLSGKAARLRKPPKGESWVWLTGELLASPAWRSMSPNTARLVNFLLIEHLNHSALENGKLFATYQQLYDFGLTRESIPDAVREAEFLGLIKAERGEYKLSVTQPTAYRLTFYADHVGNSATQEWKGKTQQAIDEWKSDRRAARAKVSKKRSKKVDGKVVNFPVRGAKNAPQ